MRTCSRCGAQFPDDELICPVCGQEVQLVPDYVTIESRFQKDELKKEEEEKKRREEQERLAAIEARKKQIKRNVTLTICLAAAAVIAIILFVVFARVNRNTSSFNYQYQQALDAYEAKDYETAEEYVNSALKLESKNTDAQFLLCEIYAGEKETDKEEAALLELIKIDPNYTKAYDLLIGLYQDEGDTDKIVDLLKNTKNKDVLTKYAKYLVSDPVINPNGGAFKKETSVTISDDSKGTIYYTTDGSNPTKDSDSYASEIELSEGTTTIKAILITDEGVKSNIVSATFHITFDTPPTPEIQPSSGTYTGMEDNGSLDSGEAVSSDSSENTSEITVVVPDGYTCYYSFDKKPTEQSSKYKNPVAMREGEHIFYAVLQDNETGKLGKVASETYIYSIVTPTPSPTPSPEPTQEPQSQTPSSYVTPDSTRDAEEVENPTPTPTEEPTPTPSENSSSENENTENGNTDTNESEPTPSPEATQEPSSETSTASNAENSGTQQE